VINARYAAVCRIANTVRSNFLFLKAADLCPERAKSFSPSAKTFFFKKASAEQRNSGNAGQPSALSCRPAPDISLPAVNGVYPTVFASDSGGVLISTMTVVMARFRCRPRACNGHVEPTPALRIKSDV
jgi:hypothetical protein